MLVLPPKPSAGRSRPLIAGFAFLAIAAVCLVGSKASPRAVAAAPAGVTVTSSYHPKLGLVRGVCDKSGDAPKLYFDVDKGNWTSLIGYMAGLWVSLDLPEGCAPFKSVFVSYEVGGSGHPPWDGRQFGGEPAGGYGVPHADVHFNTMTGAERMNQVGFGSCETVPGVVTPTGEPEFCNMMLKDVDPKTAKYYNLPPAEYTTGFQGFNTFGGAGVVGHGQHMGPDADFAPGGPSACSGTPAPAPEWAGCMDQFMGVIMGKGFSDKGCKCGTWDAMQSPVLNVFDGKVIGNEVMPMIDLANKVAKGAMPNPYLQEFPQAAKYGSSGHQTTHVFSEVVGSRYHAGLLLSPTWKAADM